VSRHEEWGAYQLHVADTSPPSLNRSHACHKFGS
jgi:hypothetical protein